MKRKGPTSTGRHGVPGVMPGAHLPLPVRPKAAPAMRPVSLLWNPPATLEGLLLRGPGDPGRVAAGRPAAGPPSGEGGASSSGAQAGELGEGEPEEDPARWDLQEIVKAPPASQAKAKATALSPELLAEWLVRLAEREFAVTSVGPKAAKLRLMEWLLEKGDGGVYPLTPHRIRVGAACLLPGSYRSAAGRARACKPGSSSSPREPGPRSSSTPAGCAPASAR